MIPGVKIQMGGQDWLVPALTLGQLRRLREERKNLNSGDEDKTLSAVCTIVATALSRNYPDMTEQRVEELIDLENRDRVVAAVLGNSGLKPGEAEAVTRQNGPLSMAFSPPPADTAIQ
jgi:1-deoxy-D-xylulose 5-phosphate reductoisomerase